MKKLLIMFLSFFFVIHQGFALSCTDLPSNVSRYQESNSVLLLQTFLFDKGFLKASPNGYFGTGTFLALKEYQRSEGVSDTGVAGPLTREMIKKASCGGSSVSPVKTSVPIPTMPAVASPSSVSSPCTDLPSNVSRYQESNSVLLLQTFLFDKGFLKASPNGYFGTGTFLALKEYQRSEGVSDTGVAGPLTREMIKKASCGGSTGKGAVTAPAAPVITSPSKVSSVATTTASATSSLSKATSTAASIRNIKRRSDAEILLKALYSRFVESRGVHPISLIDTPLEMCVTTTPSLAEVASSTTSTTSAVVITKESPCAKYVDISNLSPNYLTQIPRDPGIATSSMLIGYTITRGEYNDVTVAAKLPEDKAIIEVKCNFNGFCRNIEHISTPTYKKPELTSLSRIIVLRDSFIKTPLLVKGKHFTQKNTIKLFSLYNNKEYVLGEFSTTQTSSTTSTISLEGEVFNKELPCGSGCLQKLPLGEYMLSISNEGGQTSSLRLVIRGYTTSTLSTRDTTVPPKATGIKVATITLSSSIPVTLKTITLTSTSSSATLAAKIPRIVLKDTLSGISYPGTTSFSLGGVTLPSDQSRIYDVYIDTSEILNSDAGAITFGGKVLVGDTLFPADIELPIKEFSFSVSY